MNPTLPEFPAFPTDLPDRKILNVTDRSLISTNGYYEQIKIFARRLTVDVSLAILIARWIFNWR